jgi:hypothetical protein
MDQKTRKNGIRANEKEGEGGRGKGETVEDKRVKGEGSKGRSYLKLVKIFKMTSLHESLSPSSKIGE